MSKGVRSQKIDPYDHSRNAGNRADVWKHFILMELLAAISGIPRPWEEPFCYLDTHCGHPLYVLAPGGNWKGGIGRVFPPPASLADRPYFRILGSLGDPRVMYPSSWVQVSLFLLQRGVPFKAVLRDLSPKVEESLWGMGLRDPSNGPLEFKRKDGFSSLEKGTSWDLVLVDPPFLPDPRRDFQRCADMLERLRERARAFLIWYPLFSFTERPWRGVLRERAFEVTWDDLQEGTSMRGCGALVGGHEANQIETLGRTLAELAASLNGTLRVLG